MRWGLAECVENFTMDSPDLDVFDRPPNVFFKEVFYQPLLCSATAFLALWRTGGTVYGRDLEEKLCACIMRCIHDTNSHHVAITGLSVVNCQILSVSTILFDHP